jgi:hypothetical protein
MKDKQFAFMQRIAIASCLFVLVSALVSFSAHKFNLFTAGIVEFGLLCSIVAFIASVVFIFTCRMHRTIYCALAAGFGILLYLLLFGFNGRSILWELHQYRRDRWFLEVGKPIFEKHVPQNTNYLGQTYEELQSDISDVRIMGKRNEDGSVDLEFVLVGGVPRQAYLYHTGDPSGKFSRQYKTAKMVTNDWYDVSF